ncbi:MAG TPA: hypothetical protein VHI13_18185 [Candidatus Kapabacteria bacterium]|nr:hypothetical protein [Candidatus Kapabacteria bacterium]
MKNRFLLPGWALSLLMALLLGAASNGRALAQADSCCIRINNNTSICHVDVCVTTPSGAQRCITVYAGTSDGFRFPCDSNTVVIVSDACGMEHRLHPNDCVRVQLRSGCCATACLHISHDGCYQLDVNENAGPCQC